MARVNPRRDAALALRQCDPNLTIREIAAQVGVHESTVGRWLHKPATAESTAQALEMMRGGATPRTISNAGILRFRAARTLYRKMHPKYCARCTIMLPNDYTDDVCEDCRVELSSGQLCLDLDKVTLHTIEGVVWAIPYVQEYMRERIASDPAFVYNEDIKRGSECLKAKLMSYVTEQRLPGH